MSNENVKKFKNDAINFKIKENQVNFASYLNKASSWNTINKRMLENFNHRRTTAHAIVPVQINKEPNYASLNLIDISKVGSVIDVTNAFPNFLTEFQVFIKNFENKERKSSRHKTLTKKELSDKSTPSCLLIEIPYNNVTWHYCYMKDKKYLIEYYTLIEHFKNPEFQTTSIYKNGLEILISLFEYLGKNNDLVDVQFFGTSLSSVQKIGEEAIVEDSIDNQMQVEEDGNNISAGTGTINTEMGIKNSDPILSYNEVANSNGEYGEPEIDAEFKIKKSNANTTSVMSAKKKTHEKMSDHISEDLLFESNSVNNLGSNINSNAGQKKTSFHSTSSGNATKKHKKENVTTTPFIPKTIEKNNIRKDLIDDD